MSRNSSALAIAVAFVASGALTPCYAQRPASATPPASATQRQAQIDRVRDGLNSPDPTTRLVTLEQALRSRDAVLRRVALSTSFASKDDDLRSLALAGAVESLPSLVVTVPDPIPKSWFSASLGPTTEVRLSQFRHETNTFQALTSLSRIPGSGAVSGDRISFEFPLDRVGNPTDSCRVVASLRPGSSTLGGDMDCSHNGGLLGSQKLHLDITINVLK